MSCDTGGNGNNGNNTNENEVVDINVEEDDLGLARDCNNLTDLANSPSFQQRMQELIANNSGNTEIGYYGRNDANDNMVYDANDRFESMPNAQEVKPNEPNTPCLLYTSPSPRD